MTTPNGMDGRMVLRGVEARLDRALKGVRTVLAPGVSLELAGQVKTPTELDALLSAALVVSSAPRELRVQLLAAIVAKDSSKQTHNVLLANFKAALVAHYGRENPILLEFGFKPYKKPEQPTAAERVANAAAKKAANPSTTPTTNPGPSNHAA